MRESISTSIYMSLFWNFGKDKFPFNLCKFPFNTATQVLSLETESNIISYQPLSSPVSYFRPYLSKHITLIYFGNWKTLTDRFIWKTIETYCYHRNLCFTTIVPSCSRSLLVAIDLTETWSRCNADFTRCFWQDTSYLRIHFVFCMSVSITWDYTRPIHFGIINGTICLYIYMYIHNLESIYIFMSKKLDQQKSIWICFINQTLPKWSFFTLDSSLRVVFCWPFPVKIAKRHRLSRFSKRHWVSLSGTSASASSLSGRNGVQISGR